MFGLVRASVLNDRHAQERAQWAQAAAEERRLAQQERAELLSAFLQVAGRPVMVAGPEDRERPGQYLSPEDVEAFHGGVPVEHVEDELVARGILSPGGVDIAA